MLSSVSHHSSLTYQYLIKEKTYYISILERKIETDDNSRTVSYSFCYTPLATTSIFHPLMRWKRILMPQAVLRLMHFAVECLTLHVAPSLRYRILFPIIVNRLGKKNRPFRPKFYQWAAQSKHRAFTLHVFKNRFSFLGIKWRYRYCFLLKYLWLIPSKSSTKPCIEGYRSENRRL